MPEQDCVFCNLPDDKVVIRNGQCFGFWSKHEVNQGHMLVVPYRHFADYFDATEEEKAALWNLVDEVKEMIDKECKPDGLNVGINIGEAAGQSIKHLHIHIIPRYRGDMDDPSGGVRGVIPDRQKY